MAKVPGQRKPGSVGGGDHYQSRMTAGRLGGRKRRRWPAVAVLVVIGLLAILVIATAGCGGRARAQESEPVDGAPTVHVTWIHAEDTRTPIADIPWCADYNGGGNVYPCKWDTRERPAVGWDPQAAPVAIWVRPNDPCPIGKVKISEDNSVPWACYWKGYN